MSTQANPIHLLNYYLQNQKQRIGHWFPFGFLGGGRGGGCLRPSRQAARPSGLGRQKAERQAAANGGRRNQNLRRIGQAALNAPRKHVLWAECPFSDPLKVCKLVGEMERKPFFGAVRLQICEKSV